MDYFCISTKLVCARPVVTPNNMTRLHTKAERACLLVMKILLLYLVSNDEIIEINVPKPLFIVIGQIYLESCIRKFHIKLTRCKYLNNIHIWLIIN